MRKFKNTLSYIKLGLGIGISVLVLLAILTQVLINGLGYITWDFLFNPNAPRGETIVPAAASTLLIVVLTLLVAAPIGICSAIYLNEYANKNSRVVKGIRIAIETLSGIPSIIYGLFGFLFYVSVLGWGWSIRAGVLTVAIMVLPIIIRSTEEALKSVPNTYREASFGLGAGKFYTIYKVILPSAITGILASIILSVGRIVGETAALLFTAGTLYAMPTSLSGSAATISVFMYTMTVEGSSMEKAYAAAVVLMVIVLALNLLANFIGRKLKRD